MQVQLPNVRIAFCDSLYVKRSVMDGKPQHSANFILKPNSDAHKTILKAIQEVGQVKWGAKWPKIEKELNAANKICCKDGDLKSDYDGFEGNFFIAASNSMTKVGVFDRDANLTEDESLIYAGCYVNGVIDVWAQDNNYGKRINARLEGVQFLRDGDAFGAARINTKNLFKPIDTEVFDDAEAMLG